MIRVPETRHAQGFEARDFASKEASAGPLDAAAVRVLTRHGARRFTTVRVAEDAGVSVGSLYQYFPSKEALLYRLQTDEWAETSLVLEEIVSDTSRPPLDRLRRLVLVFFRSERQEAALRVALDDAGALFRDAPEARALYARVNERFSRFLEEALPAVPPAERSLAADVIVMSMSAAAEKITAQSRSRAEVDAWAREAAEMYCGYLERLGVLIHTDGGGLNARQRDGLKQLIEKMPIRCAVVSDGVLARLLASTFALFNRNLRSYSVAGLADAMAFLEVSDADNVRVHEALERMTTQLE